VLLKMKLAGGVTTTINVRISQSISAGIAPVYSNVVPITVTPYNLASFIYVVGAYQGWNANNPDSLLSATSNGIYQGIINYTAGNNQFLILPQKGSYNNKIATTNSTTPSTTTLVNANNNLVAPAAAGQYVVTYNSNSNTITFALANYYSIIGSDTPGGNYSTDIDFKYSNDATNDWVGTFALTAGAFKIRQNHDWTWSWGDISPVDGIHATDANGANINTATAKNYVITFSIPITAQAAGFVPQAIATYTIK
jgi:starch-binding outer membrane protein SusE/F